MDLIVPTPQHLAYPATRTGARTDRDRHGIGRWQVTGVEASGLVDGLALASFASIGFVTARTRVDDDRF